MKKFTKGCLITALILFVFGCAFAGISGTLGGFRQLEDLSDGGIDIKWNFFGISIPWFYIGDWGNDWDWGESGYNAQSLTGSSMTQTQYQNTDIAGIDIELGAVNLTIKESEDDYIWLENKSSKEKIKYGVKNGVFKLYNKNTFRSIWGFGAFRRNGSVCLYLPKGMELSDIDIEMGAGNVQSIGLEADEISLEAGAGKFVIDSLRSNDINISVGAGKADVNSIDAGTLTIEAGAGSMELQNIAVRDLNAEAAAGFMDIAGSVSGNAEIECAAGSVDVTLQGTENDFNYQVECAAGTVTIGGSRYSGIADERSINNHSMQSMDIECSAGTVNVDFVN